MEPAIATDALSKAYGPRIAVANLTLDVPRGSVFALLGPNGAGKTTTVEMLACLRKPTSGTARVLGYDVSTSPSEVRSRIGILPQSVAGHEALTVQETLHYFAALYDRSADLESLMATLGLTSLARQRFGRLSGGQRRRVGIAAALVNDPDIVFLDEPTAGLDPAARRDLWKTLRGLRSRGKVIFLTTHHIEEAERLADDVGILVDGRLVARGTPHALARAHGGARTILLPACGTAGQETLARAGIASRLDGRGDLLVSLGEKEDVSSILSMLEKGGVDLGDVQVRSASLESAYLSLVKGRAASAGDAP